MNAPHTPPPPTLVTKMPKVGTTIFTVMSALAAERSAVNLGQGFPDFDCDPALLDAAARSPTRSSASTGGATTPTPRSP